MSKITVYTTEPCGYCRTAKALLHKRRVPYEEINLARPIGGYQELVCADRDGLLDDLAAAA